MSTYKEIASRAGVSIGTVYRVLHERGRYSRRTAERVRRVADALGYKKNIYASNLSRSRSYRIAVLIPEPSHDNSYWAQPHRGIATAIEALEHYRLSRTDFFYDEHCPESFSRELHRVAGSGFDAAIVAPAPAAEREPLLTQGHLEIPHVIIDSLVTSPGRLGFVGQDSYASGRAAGRLIELLSPVGGRVVLVRSLPASHHIDLRMADASPRSRREDHRSRPGSSATRTLRSWPTCALARKRTRRRSSGTISCRRMSRRSTTDASRFCSRSGPVNRAGSRSR